MNGTNDCHWTYLARARPWPCELDRCLLVDVPRRVHAGLGSRGLCARVGGVCFELFDELFVCLDAVCSASHERVVSDGLLADPEVFGDLGVGPAFDEAVEDFVALGGGAVLGGFGVVEFFLAGEGGGDLDFVAEEEAGGEGGDDVVPGVVGGPGDAAADAVAVVAGEGGRGVV